MIFPQKDKKSHKINLPCWLTVVRVGNMVHGKFRLFLEVAVLPNKDSCHLRTNPRSQDLSYEDEKVAFLSYDYFFLWLSELAGPSLSDLSAGWNVHIKYRASLGEPFTKA